MPACPLMPAALATPIPALRDAAPEGSVNRAGWHALLVFCGYRIALALALAVAHFAFGGLLSLGGARPERVDPLLLAYGAVAVLLLLPALLRRPALDTQVSVGVALDVALVVALQHLTIERLGLEVLLLITIAAAALISRGRFALFQAALATVGLLGEQTFRLWRYEAPVSDFLQAGLTSASYFATAGLGWLLARYAHSSEALARERAAEVAALSRVNELVVRDMPQGLLVVDADGRLRTRNAAAEQLLGPAPAAPSTQLADVAPQLAERLSAWRAGLGASTTPVATGRARAPDLVATFLDPGLDRRGPVVVLLEDVGRLREQARQMKLVALGRLTASIAHEIRNPLSSINQAAELLADSTAPEAGQARLVSIIRGNVDRLDRIVSEVLDLNRRARAEPDSVDLEGFLNQFAASFCASERLPPASLSVEVAPGLRAQVDRQHLDRVLWNLARNAWRHGRQKSGSVRLSAGSGPRPGTVSVEVADDGPGLSAEARAHLFEPFFTTDPQGIGLGLFIARELCEGNGGSLDAVDAASGARFRITLRAV